MSSKRTQSESTMTNTEKTFDPEYPIDRAAMAARARKIREAAQGAKMSATEQVRVAENMWRILEALERRGFSKATVLREGGAGNDGDSTKRLARFALNPELDPAKKAKKAADLTKGTSPYLRIAEAAGRLAERDEDAYVTNLFNGTRFAAAGDTALTEDFFVELSELIRTVSAGVARKHDLQRVFQLADERRLAYYNSVYCGGSGQLRQNREGRWSGLWHQFADGAEVVGLLTDQETWSMPYPSILIGYASLVSDLHFGFSQLGSGLIPATERNAIEGKILFTREGALKLEVRIGLLPLGPDGAVEPAFITCPWLDIPFGHMREKWEPDQDGRMTVLTDEWHFVSEVDGYGSDWSRRGLPQIHSLGQFICHPQFGEEAWLEAFRPFAGEKPARHYQDFYRSYTPVRVELVSPASCRRLLALERTEHPNTRCCASVVVDDLDPRLDDLTDSDRYKFWRRVPEDIDDPESPAWRSDTGTLAEAVENSLLGHARDGHAFDVVLDTVCARTARQVRETLETVDAWHEARKADLRRKWGPGVDNNEPPNL